MQGQCRFCGQVSDGVSFEKWVKPTFTDFDKLQAGEIVCNACLFFFDEASPQLAERMGKEKPQRGVCICERWVVYSLQRKMVSGIAILSMIGHGKMFGLISYRKKLITTKPMTNWKKWELNQRIKEWDRSRWSVF